MGARVLSSGSPFRNPGQASLIAGPRRVSRPIKRTSTDVPDYGQEKPCL